MTRLKKHLSLFDVWGITSGAVLSSGLFVLPGIAYAEAGPAAILGYLLAAVLATTGLFSQAELATAMPKAGGTYFYVTRSMGPAAGTIYGLVTLLALALKSSFELIGMAACLSLVLPMTPPLPAVVLCLLFVSINLGGVKTAGRLQAWLTTLVVLSLLTFVAVSLKEIRLGRLDPFFENGASGIFRSAGMVFLSFGGLLKVASLAEEVKHPARDLPRGMLMALAGLILLYFCVVSVIYCLVDPAILSGSLTPLATAASTLNLPWIAPLCWVAALLAFSSAANTGIMGAARYPLALSRDRLLPEWFGKIRPETGTPAAGVLTTGIIMLAALFLDTRTLVKAASCILILTYIFTCLAVVILRESRIQNYRPEFRSPFYPWVQLAGIVGFSAMLVALGLPALATALVLGMAGLLFYLFYGSHHADTDHALLHLMARMTDRKRPSRELEDELRAIVSERDAIEKDRFDALVENARILDLQDGLDLPGLFQEIAWTVAPDLGMRESDIYRCFLSREMESSTVLTDHVAVPHLAIEGEGKFHLLVVRCRNGVCFSEACPDVKAVFALMGSENERNFHLKSLAAIAQLIQDQNFDASWMQAPDAECLRDLILIGPRKRSRNMDTVPLS